MNYKDKLIVVQRGGKGFMVEFPAKDIALNRWKPPQVAPTYDDC
jgi:hypothetical protein